jgi:uncharacterized protein (TIGR03437 family)
LLVVGAGSLSAQPFIFYRGIVNAASFAPAGLPNGSIARGSIFTVFGRDLGPADGVLVSSFPLSSTLGGVSVEVCQESNCVAAIPLFVRADQINAVMPSNAPMGRVSLKAIFNGQSGNPSPATVVPSSPGIFAANSGGFGPGIVQNFVAQDNQPLNSLRTSAGPSQVVTLWATGLGAGLNADSEPPQAGDLPVDVEILVGEKRAANKLYSGRSPCCAGVDQIVFEIPADAPQGCYVPVRVRAGAVLSNTVTVAVNASGGACSDPGSVFDSVRSQARFGVVFLERSLRLVDDEFGNQQEISSDALIATFREETPSDFYFNPIFSRSPPGSCQVLAVRGDAFETAPLPGQQPARELDAGRTLQITSANGARLGPRRSESSEFYSSLLGGTVPAAVQLPLFLNVPGVYTVAGKGGADVGPFEVQVSASEPAAWANRSQTTVVRRSQSVTVNFAGGAAAGRMLSVWGGGYDQPTDSSTVFVCSVDGAANSFTVPATVLANIPAVRPYVGLSKGWLAVVSLVGGRSAFSATGIESGVALLSVTYARTVDYE